MSGKYTQEELLKMAKERPNTLMKHLSGERQPDYIDIVANEDRLEMRRLVEQMSSNVATNLREGSWDEPQVNPNEILHNMLDHIHDGNREELIGEMILMLGWLHKGGTMPNISKDTVTSTTLWIIPQND